MEDAQYVVLQAKAILAASDFHKQSLFSRSEFVNICTSAARTFLVSRRGVNSYCVPFTPGDESGLAKIVAQEAQFALKMRSEGGNAVASPKTSFSASKNMAAAADRLPSSSLEPTSLPPLKVAVARLVKSTLDPLFRADKVTREQYSTLVMAITGDFFAMFPTSNAQSTTLTDAEENWIVATTHQRAEALVGQNSPSNSRKAASPKLTSASPLGATATPPHRSGDAAEVAPNASEFTRSLEKLKAVVEESWKAPELTPEQETFNRIAAMGNGSTGGGFHSPKAVEASERNERRNVLIEEIRILHDQLTELNAQLLDKVEQLQALQKH